MLATVVLLFLIGYASQRSGVCMVRAVREVIERRRLHRLAGLALAAGTAMMIMALAELGGAQPFDTILGTPPDIIVVAGGVLFGLGSLLVGNCAIGVLAALTAGEVSRSAAIAAMFVAALLLGPDMSMAVLALPPRSSFASPLTDNALLALPMGGTLAVAAGAHIHHRIGWKRLKGGWSPLVAMSLVGTASGILFALDRHWVYTSRIAELAQRGMAAAPATLVAMGVLMSGMVTATLAGGTFQIRMGRAADWMRDFAGGLLMGLGATLVPGGNDTMLFTGVPLLLPNLLVAYAAFAATLFAALLLRRRIAATET